jgi:hypothetical protein
MANDPTADALSAILNNQTSLTLKTNAASRTALLVRLAV